MPPALILEAFVVCRAAAASVCGYLSNRLLLSVLFISLEVAALTMFWPQTSMAFTDSKSHFWIGALNMVYPERVGTL